jgi:hypothetical protein
VRQSVLVPPKSSSGFSFRRYRRLLLLAAALGAVITVLVVRSRPGNKKRYFFTGGKQITATANCASGAAPMASFDMGFKNATDLVKLRKLQVVLHRDLGCLRVTQELPFSAIARDKTDATKIERQLQMGTLRVSNIIEAPFQELNGFRRNYLVKKLAVPASQLTGRRFELVEVELVSVTAQ